MSLSEQEILDCDNSNYKCNGGAMEPTYDFIRDMVSAPNQIIRTEDNKATAKMLRRIQLFRLVDTKMFQDTANPKCF